MWAGVVAEELARSGVGHACVTPGNRSGPLAFALAALPGLRVWSHVDERSAAFFALGLAKATRGPPALLCTSGTAAANFLPAVVEAYYSRTPLVVLTADRPHDLRDTGANQSIDQVGIFGRYVRWSMDLPPPAVEDRALRSLRARVCRAVATARGPPAGPVHMNFPLPKPLEPTTVQDDIPGNFHESFPLAASGHPGGDAFVRPWVGRREPLPIDAPPLKAALEEPKGVIVVGPQADPSLPGATVRLAEALGWPILADPLSGLRFGPDVDLICGSYDTLLRNPWAREALAPRVILRLGGAPISDVLLEWLEETGPLQIIIDDDPDWKDPLHLPGHRLLGDPAPACDALASAAKGPRDRAWGETWRRLEKVAWDCLHEGCKGTFFEGPAMAATLDAVPPHTTLFVSNSLPIRDIDSFGRPNARPLRILGNRGASGIDGVTSTALGVAAATEGPVVLITGDLAFYHDLPGLLAIRRCLVEATMVVLHNDGGRIFELLPAARFDPPFQDLFVTPHGLDFHYAAQMFGAAFARAEGEKAYRGHLAEALGAKGTHIIEVRFDPVGALKARRAVMERTQTALASRMGGGRPVD